MKRWIHSSNYIKTATLSEYIPESCKQYYKIDREIEQEEIDDITEDFADSSLEFIAPLVAKSKYYDVLDAGEIAYVSLCKDKDGEYRVYSITSYGHIDITDRIPEVISKVKRGSY